MLKVDDVTDQAFALRPAGEGYEIAAVDGFRTAVLEAIATRDQKISELQVELEAARSAAEGDGSPREASTSAARLLELAANSADELVAEATAEASELVRSARAEANELVTASHAEVERVSADLARRQEQQAAELDQHRAAVLGEVADKKVRVEAKLESLQQLESEHRNRLRRHFAEHLAQLDDSEPALLRAVAAD